MSENTTRAGFGFVPWLMMTLFAVASASFLLWAALQQTDYREQRIDLGAAGMMIAFCAILKMLRFAPGGPARPMVAFGGLALMLIPAAWLFMAFRIPKADVNSLVGFALECQEESFKREYLRFKDLSDIFGQSALEKTLQVASVKACPGIVSFLLDRGVSPNTYTQNGESPLLYAVSAVAQASTKGDAQKESKLEDAVRTVRLFAELFAQLRVRGIDRTERGHQFLDPSLIQHFLVNRHPIFLLGLLVRVQFAGQLPQVLASVKQIDNLNRAGEV